MTRQLNVDEILRSWLAEGVERAPEAQVSAALEEIERAPQRRAPIASRLPWPSGVGRLSRIEPIAFAAIGILVVVMGIGLGIRTGVIRLAPTPWPLPSPALVPEPSSDQAEPEVDVRTFTAPDGSFEIRLPLGWAKTNTGPDESALYVANARTEFSIRAGDADGSLLTCDAGAGLWETCSTFNHADGETLEALAAAIGLTSKDDHGVATHGPMRTVTTLDGEPARVIKIQAYEHPARGAQWVTYVVAIHNDRPFILRAWTPSEGGIDILDLIDGFSFLEPEQELETFAAPDGSFEIRLPGRWNLDDGPDPSALYLVGQAMRLSIRAGDADGRLLTCDEGAGPWETCSTYRDATGTLDSLAAAIGLTSAAEEGIAPLGPTRSETTLDGEPAKVETIEAYEYPARGAEFVAYVVAMHDGRPFILRAWSPGSASIDILDLIDGFSFLEPDPTPTPSPSPEPTPEQLETFEAPDGTFEIRLPISWNLASGQDPTALYVSNGSIGLSIRAGDADGSVNTCDAPAASWELCRMVTATTLEELGDAIGLLDADYWLGPLTQETTLRGEPAIWVRAVGKTPNPLAVGYIVTIHGGRPFVVRASQHVPTYGLPELSRLLEGFRFVDD